VKFIETGRFLCRTRSEVPVYKRLKPTAHLKEQTMNYACPLFMCDILGDTRFCILQKLKQHKKNKEKMMEKKKDESWQMLPTERD
jgi:hypothetical protein